MIFLASTATIVGIAASVLTATSLLPQLIKMIREKKAKDISIPMLCILFIGLGLWSWYGFLIEDIIIIVDNLFSMVVTVIMIVLAIKYKDR